MTGATAPDRPLRILHIGTGFRPWRRGGLVAYVEDLMDEQVRCGHEVTYLFAGRYYPVGGPRLRRWRRGPVGMLEIVNSPIYDHGRQPELEIAEPRVERIVEREISRLRPDIVHVQELAGLPSSVLDVARCAGVPVLLTLQDYFALCPTFKLLDAQGKVCLRREIGADCVATVAAEERDPALLFDATIRHHLWRARLIRYLQPARRRAVVQRLTEWGVALARPRYRSRPADAVTFQRRRDVNVERLNRVDRLIAMSNRVAEIHALLGVEPERLRTMQLTLAHIEHLRPRLRDPRAPVTFATLGGGESPAKGSRVLLEAARTLAGTPGFRLIVFGHPEPAFIEAAANIPGLELGGPFPPERLDAMLDKVDVGIMPSVWEEAYGYAGIEFLAKGIPVIANAIGGMVEYVRDGETGWLNRSCTAEGLARIMRDVIDHPDQVGVLNARLREERDRIILPFSRHANELEAVYREEIAARRR